MTGSSTILAWRSTSFASCLPRAISFSRDQKLTPLPTSRLPISSGSFFLSSAKEPVGSMVRTARHATGIVERRFMSANSCYFTIRPNGRTCTARSFGTAELYTYSVAGGLLHQVAPFDSRTAIVGGIAGGRDLVERSEE